MNLIEIITKKNAKKGIDNVENILAINDDNEVTLVYFEHNNKIISIEKQAQKFITRKEAERND